MPFILSFDVGIKNLAFCYSCDEKIIKWNVFDIQGGNVQDTCEICIKTLEAHFSNIEIDMVLIENQPVQKNPTMKTIQIVVYTYFMYQKAILNKIESIHFVPANRKNKFGDKFNFDIQCKTKYQKNKKVAVAVTKYLVEGSVWDTHFNSHKKKDDLADSYLQTLAFIDYKNVLPNPPEPLSETESSSTSSTSTKEMCLSIS